MICAQKRKVISTLNNADDKSTFESNSQSGTFWKVKTVTYLPKLLKFDEM